MHESAATKELLDRVRAAAGCEEGRVPRAAFFRQRGEIRLAPEGRWLPFEAEQTIESARTAFRWRARVRLRPALGVTVTDAYERGVGRLVVRLWGWLPLQRASGPDTSLGEVLRYLAELPWCPAAYLDNHELRFEAAAPDRLRVTAPSAGPAAVVELEVDPEGRVTAASCDARPRTTKGGAPPTPWRGTFDGTIESGGLHVPARAQVAWEPPEGSFPYFRAEVTEYRVGRADGRPPNRR